MPDFAFKVRLSDVSAKQISPNIARSPSAVPFYRLDFNGKVIQSDVSTQPGDPQWKHQSNFEYRLSEPSVDALFHSLASRFAVLHVLFLEPENGSGRKEILVGSCSVDLFTLACGAARCAYDLRLDTSSLSQNNGVNSSNMNAPFMSSQPITSGAITGKAEFTLVMDQQTTVSISLQTVTVTPMPYASPYKLAYSLASSAGSHEVESNVVSATTDPTWDAQLLPRIISRTTLKDLLKDTLKVTIKDVGQKGAPAVGKFEIVFSDLITSHTDHTVPFRRNAYAIAGAPSLGGAGSSSGGGGQQQQKEISRYVSSSTGGDGLVKSFQGDSATNISGGGPSLQGFSSSWGALVTGTISFKDLPHLSQLSPENSTNINGTVHGRPLLKSCVVPSSLSKYPAPSATSMMLANTSRETNRTFVKNGGVPTSATQFHNDLYGGQPTVPLSSAGHGSVSIGGQTVPIGVNLSNMTLGNHTTGNAMPPSTAADMTMNYPHPYNHNNNDFSSGDLTSVSAVRANLSTAPSSGQVGYFPTSPKKVPEVGGAVGGTRVPAFSTDGAASPMTADAIRAQLQQLEDRKAKFNIAPPPPPISQQQQQQQQQPYPGNGNEIRQNVPPQQHYSQQSTQQHRQDTTTMSAWNSPRTSAATATAAPNSSVTVTHHHHYGGGRGGAVAAAANVPPRATTTQNTNNASTFISQSQRPQQQSYPNNPTPHEQHQPHSSIYRQPPQEVVDDHGWTNPYREGDNATEAYSQMVDPLYRVRSRRGSVAVRGGGGAGAPNTNTGLPTSNISSTNPKYESRFDSPNRTTRQREGGGEMRKGSQQQQHPSLYVSSATAAEVSTLPRHVSPPRGGMADNVGVPIQHSAANTASAFGDLQAAETHRRKMAVRSPLSESFTRNGISSSSRPTSPLMSTSGRLGQQSSMMTASATMPILNNPITATGQALVDQYKEAVANIETQMARVATMESQLADQTLKEESMFEDALKSLEKEEASIVYDIKKCERVIAEIKRAQEEYISDEHKTRLETEMRENGILNELDDVARVENELIALMGKVHINIREDEIAKERAKEERERARKRLDMTSREFNDLSHKVRAADSRSRSVSVGTRGRRQMSEEMVQYRITPLRSLSPNRRGGRGDDRSDLIQAKPTSTFKSLSPPRRESETRRALDFSIRHHHHHEQSLGSSAHNNSNNEMYSPGYVNTSHLHRDPFSSSRAASLSNTNYNHRQQRIAETTATISPKRERGGGSFVPTSGRMEVGAPTLLPPLRVVESRALSPHSEREQRRREAQQKTIRRDEEKEDHGPRDHDWKSRTATLSPLRSRGNHHDYETSGEGSNFGKSSSSLPVAPSLNSIGISSIPTNASTKYNDNSNTGNATSKASTSFSNVHANGAGTDNMSVTLQLDMRDMAKAIETSNVPMFRAVLSQNPDVLYATNSWLHAACAVDKPSYEIISAIVTMRPELAHAADSITGNLPLHFLCAAREPSVKAVDCLLSAGGGSGAVAYSGPVTIHNKDGLTPFQVAVLNVYDVPSSSSTSSSSPTSPHSSRSQVASSVKELLLKRCGKEVLFAKTNKGESCAHLCTIHDKYLPNLKFLFKSGAPCSDTAIVLGAANAGLAVTPLEKSRMYGEAATEIQRYLQHVVGQ